MNSMLAARFVGPGLPLSLELVEIPEPRSGFVTLRVRACGVCGSDLSIQKGDFKVPLGLILGHEIAGELGKGERFAVYYASGCGQCPMCRRGWVVGCLQGSHRLGVTENGGFSEYVEVPKENLIPIPPNLSFEAAAVCTDAVATCFHALMDVGNIRPGEKVAIFGIGGLGVAAVQIAKAAGAHVIAVSRSTGRLALALSLGADETVQSGEKLDLSRRLGADVALQLVANPIVDQQAIACLNQGGRLVMVGFSPHPFQASSLDIVLRQITLAGSRGMTKSNIQTALEWVATRKLDVSPLLAATGKLQEINLVLDAFRAGNVLRAVIRP